jgi:hypothetical protein
MFHIMFTVSADDATDWDHAWERLNGLALEMGPKFPNVHLSSHLVNTIGEDEEYFDENTMFKVYDAIKRSYTPEPPDHLVRAIIDKMQDAGIYFREKGPRS